MLSASAGIPWISGLSSLTLSKHASSFHSKYGGPAVKAQSIDVKKSKRADSKEVGSRKAEQINGNYLQFISNLANKTKERAVSSLVDVLFQPSDEPNINFQGNFAPVHEIGARVAVRVVEGEVPKDFPTGVYIRNGPNPLFGGKFSNSPFGKTLFHWFEGDGMLHATYFGPNGEVSYQNKYVRTEAFVLEEERNKKLWLNTFEGDSKALGMAFLFNLIRFGSVHKGTANTSINVIGNRILAIMEGDKPYEINPSDLGTLGTWDWHGQWTRSFTAHSKTLGGAKETVVFGIDAQKPYLKIGVISADGERVVHQCNVNLDRAIYTHDIAITQRYNIILHWPVFMDADKAMDGGVLQFEPDNICRVGVMPRYGDSKSIKWFKVEPNFTYHVINSYEEGDEIVLYGCRSRRPFGLCKPRSDLDQKEWFSRGIRPCLPEEARDPDIDGALFERVHEWRFNMLTGSVVERDITDNMMNMDMPRINDHYIGYKNVYAYLDVLDTEASSKAGVPKYGKLAKLYFTQREHGLVKTEFHDPGPNKFFSEPLFVARPGGREEDDGWIVTYVHDERKNVSEVYIIDAQNFSNPPLTRIQLPQRVPYGFHSTFVNY